MRTLYVRVTSSQDISVKTLIVDQDGCVSVSPEQSALKQLYGNTAERAAMLRTFVHGRMRTSIVNGMEMAPLWSSVPNLTMW